MKDVLVVGSGAAGVWAAWQAAARGLDVLLIDVGLKPAAEQPLAANLYDLRRSDPDQARYLLGGRFESLHNLSGRSLSPKLKSPRFRFVTDQAGELGPVEARGFDAVQSFAYGGLANAWGAGAYRYSAEDLAGFPFGPEALAPHYDALTAEIGLSGCADDLAAEFGSAAGLQPALEPDRMACQLLGAYTRKTAAFRSAGVTVGRPRLAILSRAHAGRNACRYDNLSCWQPGLPEIYSPAMTLDRLIAEGRIAYRGGLLAESFQEKGGGVTVRARDLGGDAVELEARTLLLAAGAINSARLVLRSAGDTTARQPLLENPTSMIPLLHPLYIGRKADRDSHGLIQLNVVYRGPLHASALQGSYYSYTSPLASDVWQDFPLPAAGAVAGARYLLPAMSLLQMYYPDRPVPGNDLQLSGDGRLVLRRQVRPALGAVERHMISVLRRAGFLSHPAFVRYPEPGASIHYAGTLPAAADTSVRYRTAADGRLLGSDAVFVADSAAFPALPAKNHTFTIMAYAMRTADAAAQLLGVRA